jgi:DNA-binding XRE family transcriptional regulator
METKYIIYGLFCPFLDKVHYVGKSTTYMIRPLSHMTKSHSDKINEWVYNLKILGYKPIIKILENCTEKNLDDREKFWIDKYNQEGAYLLNKTYNNVLNIINQPPYQDNKIIIKKLGSEIKKIRISKGIQQTKLSKVINISRNTLILIENGNGGISLNNLIKVLNGLNLELTIQFKN